MDIRISQVKYDEKKIIVKAEKKIKNKKELKLINYFHIILYTHFIFLKNNLKIYKF